MILLLDTSTSRCRLILIDGNERYEDEWQADRQLAKGLLRYLQEQLQKNKKTFADITGIGAFAGPGSFTGLRIGLTVLNTIASSQDISIVSAKGDEWEAQVLKKLNTGEDEKIALPFYGGDAHITKPRK